MASIADSAESKTECILPTGLVQIGILTNNYLSINPNSFYMSIEQNELALQKKVWGSLYWNGLTLTPAWMSNYIQQKVWDEITYPFTNFNGCTAEVWEWILNLIPYFLSACNYVSVLDMLKYMQCRCLRKLLLLQFIFCSMMLIVFLLWPQHGADS